MQEPQLDLGIDKKTGADAKTAGGENHWKRKAAEAAKYDAPEQTVAWLELYDQRYRQLLNDVVRGDRNVNMPGAKSSRLENIRTWMRMHGPDNELVGLQADMINAANLVAERAPDLPGEIGEVQGAMIDAASTYAAASAAAPDAEGRIELLTAGQDVLDTLDTKVDGLGPNGQAELDPGLRARTEMLHSDLGFMLLLEQYHQDGLSDEARAKVEADFTDLHKDTIKKFKEMMDAGVLSPQMSAEWYTVISLRHKLARNGDQFSKRIRTAYPHERKPAELYDVEDGSEFDETFTTISEELDGNGDWKLPRGGRSNVRIGGVYTSGKPKPLVGSIQPIIVNMNENGEAGLYDAFSNAAVGMYRDTEMHDTTGEWDKTSSPINRAIETADRYVSV